MITKVTKVSQVLDSIDNEKVTFYYGKKNDQDELTREEIRDMTPKEIKHLMSHNLTMRKSR